MAIGDILLLLSYSYIIIVCGFTSFRPGSLEHKGPMRFADTICS